jgi:hypothetical protein
MLGEGDSAAGVRDIGLGEIRGIINALASGGVQFIKVDPAG